MKKEHECIIGLIRMSYADDHALITEKELLGYISCYLKEDKEMKEFRRVVSLPKPFDIEDYRNTRKKTNLKRFNYCPICGNKIYWKNIGAEND